METYPISLALFDFIPNFFFLTGAFFLAKTTLICSGPGYARLLMAGASLVFLGGFFKALWKLIYAAQWADIRWMSDVQFLLLGIGFLMIFLSVLRMVRKPKNNLPPAMFLGAIPVKIPLIFLTTTTSLGAEGILTYIAFQRKLNWAAAGFIVGVLGILAMGALAGAEQSVAMQWVAEATNTIGQGGFMLGNLLLYRDFKKRGCQLPN